MAAGCSSSSSTTSGTSDGGNPGQDAGPAKDAGNTGTPDAADAAVCDKVPAAGFSTVLKPLTDGTELGSRAQVAVDKNGLPVFAYLDGAVPSAKATLYFVSWDTCTGAWKAPVKVDTAIDNQPGSGAHVVTLSVDPSDGRIGIAYQKTVHLVSPPRANDSLAAFVAISSDNGATFTATKVSKHSCETDVNREGDANDVHDPELVLAGGKTFVAYNQTQQGCGTSCHDSTVLATGTAGAYAYEVVQDGVDATYSGTAATRAFPIGLAVDSAGKPALAVHIDPPAGYNTKLVYWRPGGTTVNLIVDTNNVQNDFGGSSLAFDGLKPRIVSRIQRGAINAVTDYDLVFQSSDDGATWSAPLPLARPEAISPGQHLYINGGKATIAAGGPHIYTSTNLTTWTIDDLGAAQTSTGVSAAFAKDGTTYFGVEGTFPVVGSALGGLVIFKK
jgi:hypothetical protein